MIGWLNSSGTAWGEFSLPMVIQNTVFLGMVLVILRLIRRAPARVRYGVACAGLVKLFIPPFIRLPVFERAADIVSGGYGLIPFVSGPEEEAIAGMPAPESISPAGALLAVWVAAAAAGLLFVIFVTARLIWRLRSAEELRREDIPRVPGIGRARVLRSSRIAMPLTAAFLPGRIYVPAAWDGWTPQCREIVLRHEMAHLDRRDGAVLTIQMIARAVYFFHPLVVLLDRKISGYREMACDDAAAGRDRDSGVEYSRYLVEIAESVVRCPAVCGSASALIRRKNELLERVSYQLEEGRMRSIPRTRLLALSAAIVLLAVSLSWYGGGASAQSDPPPPPPKEATPPPPPKGATPPPPPKGQDRAGERLVRPVNVLLRSDGAELDGKKVGMEELAEALGIFAGKDPENVVVHVYTTPDAKMGEVQFVQQTMRKLGINTISYRTFDGKDLPLELPPRKALERLEEMPDAMKINLYIGKGSLKVGSRDVKLYDLEGVIREKLEETPMAVVVVHFESDANYGDFTGVIEILKAAHADRVAVKIVEEN